VPAGIYLVIGQARLINDDGDRQIASCGVNGQLATGGYLEPVDGSDSEDIIEPITTTASPDANGKITISCCGFAIHADDIHLIAIKVDTIN